MTRKRSALGRTRNTERSPSRWTMQTANGQRSTLNGKRLTVGHRRKGLLMSTSPPTEARGPHRRRYGPVYLAVVVTAVATVAVTALLVNIFEHKQEGAKSLLPRRRARPTTPTIRRSGARTSRSSTTATGAPSTRCARATAAARPCPRTPTDGRPAVDRRAVAARGGPAPEDDVGRLRLLEGLPRGTRPRLHARRPDVHRAPAGRRSSPARACTATRRSTCRTSKLGGGDLIKGFELMNQMPYVEARKLVTHPVACIDCHDPATMQLRVTRPGFIEGIRAFKASQGVAELRREHRRHAAGDARLRLRAVPRRVLLQGRRRSGSPTRGRKGLKVDEHPRLLRRDRLQGLDARRDRARRCSRRSTRSSRCGTRASTRGRGVTCADCHMPYMREGALKISDHHVRSPLLNINRACQTCHKWPEDELRDRGV